MKVDTMNADAHLNLEEVRFKALKQAMGCFATGIAVVTTRHDGADYGMTCNSFNTVSLDPALVLWSVQRSSSSHEAFMNGGGYTVSILAADQQDLVRRFARGTQAERFASLPTTRLASGRLVIGGSVAWFDCEMATTVGAGDHDVLIGHVLEFASTPKPPLVYVNGRFVTTGS